MDKIKILVKNRSLLDGVVHGSIWRQGAFTWEPQAFVLESPKLDGRIIEASVMVESLTNFREHPTVGQTYVVSGNPDDSKAKYFAAYLASIHKERLQHHANIIWENVFGGFDNLLLKKDTDPSLLILSGLAENSTNIKFEKARDLIERWPDIPKIVICAGEDPISFASSKLHVAAHSIAYFPSRIAKTVQEVL
jgi:hypothetical protein